MKVRFDDIEFDPTCQLIQYTASYKGQPFTGTAYEIEDNCYYEWNYKNGNAEGRWYGINQQTNLLLYDEFYIDGNENGDSKEWYDNGQLSRVLRYEHGKMIQLKYWNSDNVLVKWIDEEQQVNEEYYDNGELYKRTFSQEKKYEEQYFLSKSQWLMTWDSYQANDKDSFNASLILKELPNLTALFHRSVIARFAIYLINNNKQQALEFLSQLSQHQEAYFRSEAASLLGQLQLLAGIPYLQALLNDHEKPFVDDRFEVGGFGNLLPINERATRAIQQIRQHQKNE